MSSVSSSDDRLIANASVKQIRVDITNRSTHYAAYWLQLLTGEPLQNNDTADIVITGPVAGSDKPDDREGGCVIRLWDYQVGHEGDGRMASAISGAATVIGNRSGPPAPLPADMPEKWCGAHGVILALAELWRRNAAQPVPVTYDLSAADILRSFCLQNSGGPDEMVRSWKRNGRLCIEHGGIFPMGFFACRDGYVAVLGRSRRDWKNIRAAIGDPDWAAAPEFENPFSIARDSAAADALLEQTLADFTRDELLRRGIAHGAVIAPVFSQAEAHQRSIFRSGFIEDGLPRMPFVSQVAGARKTEALKQPSTPPSNNTPGAPLAGLRVIELCWVWSGPMVGQILADLGAEVIKVESPQRFDLYRTRGLEAQRGQMDEKTRIESSLYFHSLNRNKLGLSLDLKSEQGQQRLKDLAARSHILLENFTVGTMERLGLGPAAMAAANPSLVQLSMSGPGRGSSLESLRSYGLVLSALAGAEISIEADGEFVGSPTFSISDPNAAVFATIAALAAAIAAKETGTGLSIDLSQIEAAATLAGSPTLAQSPYSVIQGDDGGYAIVQNSSGGVAPDSGGAKTALPPDRAGNPQKSAPVLHLEETDRAPQFADCSGWLPSNHPVSGPENLVAAPWRVDGKRPEFRTPAPQLGQDTSYVLGQILGLTKDEISALEADGATGLEKRKSEI